MFPLVQVKNDLELEGFHNVYYFEFGKNHYHPTEKHQYWEMVYVDKGKILANTNGNICTLEEGQAIFHGPGEIHAHVSNKQVANNMLVVSFSCGSSCMDFFSGKTFTLDKTCKTLLTLFINEAKNALGDISGDFFNHSPLVFDNAEFGSSQLMKYHFTEFLIKLLRNGTFVTDSSDVFYPLRADESNQFLDSIIQYLSDNVCNNLSLEDVCNKFFIRKSRLSVIFKEYTGKSPMHFFKDLKLKQAKKLLLEENMSVSQICDLLGYSSIHNFTRFFKSATGFSPTGYRKSLTFSLTEKRKAGTAPQRYLN